MQLVLRFGYLKLQAIPLALNNLQYILLVLSTICIAAGGYIINNIFDVETDRINRPKQVVVGESISEAMAYNMYAGFTITGVVIGFYLSNLIERPSFASIFIIIAATLYFYAANLKQSLLIGNIIVALLLSFSIIIVAIFDLIPVTNYSNRATMAILFKILLDYAIFAFVLNFIREIVKDLQDIKGDVNEGMVTLPIVFGVSRTVKLVFGMSIIPVVMVVYYLMTYVFVNGLMLSSIYGILLILAPLCYFTINMWSAKDKAEFSHLSQVLKVVVFFSIFSIAVITYNILHHAK
jgi:4-hydroxybenzoate polyprenyltransferase